MTYDSTTRSFDIDTRNARGLDKYVGDGQLIPEIYWASIKYHWEKTKDKGMGLALKQFQECLANCGIPVPGPPIEWELKSIPRDTPTGTTLWPYQAKAVKQLVRGSMILGDSMGLGKQQPVDSKVCTPTGYRLLGDLQVGDLVIGSDGKPTAVTGIFPQGTKPSYRITFSDGANVEAGPEHLWAMTHRKGGKVNETLVVTTEELRTGATLDRPNGGKLCLAKADIKLPMLSAPVEYAPQPPLPIPPYTLGALIANGSIGGVAALLTTHKEDWLEVCLSLLSEVVEIGSARAKPGCVAAGLPGLMPRIRSLGLNKKSADKRIPVEYLHSTVINRVALLQGLMDGDGSISKTNNKLSYSTTSEGLAEDLRYLVMHLGGIASVNCYYQTGKPLEYRVRIRLPKTIQPFSVSRKLSRYNPGNRAHPVRSIKSIEYVRHVESVCISVAAADHLYLTEDAIVTHNTLSALWAWWLLGRRWGGGPLLTIITPSDDVADEWRIAARTHLGDDCVTHLKTGGVGRVWEEPAVAVPYFRCWRDGYKELIKHRLSLYQAQNQGSILVLDEAHRVSRCDSVQHKFLWSLVRDNPHIRVWALSGTEVSNTPDGYYGLYRMVTRSKLPQVAWKAFVQDLWTGVWNETRLKQIHTLRRGFALRRTSENVGQELPPLIEIDCKVEMHPVQAQLYAEIKNEQQMSVVTDPNAPAQTVNITHFWTSNIRLTQVASHPLLVGDKTVGKTPKYERLMELVEGAGDEKIIIWCNFPKSNNWLAEQLEKDFPGKKIARAHGGISKDDRQIAKTEFQAGRVDILIANPAVWSEGVNLIPGRIMIYWDYTASRVQWEQSRKRSHRTGQTKTVTIYKLITIGSIEVKWLHWLTRKASLADLISGG